MTYKKHYNGAYGKSSIVTWENSTLENIEADMVKLRPGETKTYNEEDVEYGLIILGGTCSVIARDFHYENIGKRKNPFDGPATAVYVPRNTKFTIVGVTEVTVAVAKCPAERDCPPALVLPEDIIIKDLGKPGWERQAHFVLDNRVDGNLIYIGECIIKGGQWSSFPPHKHDDDNMPTEGQLEELYYFEFDKPQGFGIQKVYTKEGDIDETYTVKTGDFVEIPRGYHPFCAAPGYDNYMLWIMAGKNRGIFATTDEDHAWLNK